MSIGIAQSLDILRYITGLSAQTNSELHYAVQMRHQMNFLFNEDNLF